MQVFQTAWHLALNISEMQWYIKHVNSGCSWKPKQAWSKNFMYLANTKLWNKEHPGNFIEKQRSCCQKHEGFLAVRFIQVHSTCPLQAVWKEVPPIGLTQMKLPAKWFYFSTKFALSVHKSTSALKQQKQDNSPSNSRDTGVFSPLSCVYI